MTYNSSENVGCVRCTDTTAEGIHNNDTTERVADEDNWSLGALDHVVIEGGDHDWGGSGGLAHDTGVRDKVLVGAREGVADVGDECFEERRHIGLARL